MTSRSSRCPVAGLLERAGFDAGQPLIRATATEVIRAWTADDYQIMHLAGHGVLDHAMGTSRGGKEVRSTGLILSAPICFSREARPGSCSTQSASRDVGRAHDALSAIGSQGRGERFQRLREACKPLTVANVVARDPV